MGSTASLPAFPREQIWEALHPASPFADDWRLFRHHDLTIFLHGLARRAAVPLQLGQAGLSEEGCSLHTVRFGCGERRILVWARQHGNEPDCSAALAMALEFLTSGAAGPWGERLLERLELLVLPMVNPDGAARFIRHNAQGIDLNRDAVALAGAESQALMTLKHGFEPEYCFNLHDMNPRKTTEAGELVALAVQAGPFEQRDIDNETRLKAKAVCGIMAEEGGALASGHIARYTADYMPRAFGDSMMRWGVSSILIEAGGWFPGQGGDDFVRRLFALTFLRGLHAIAAGEDGSPAGELYERIPFDGGEPYCDLLLRGAEVANGRGRPPFRADLAINRHPLPGNVNEPRFRGTLEEIGDLEDQRAIEEADLSGSFLMPGLMVVSPGARFAGDFPTDGELAPYLRAGITTLACGFGPFHQGRDLDQWMAASRRGRPLVNLLAFERVRTLEEVRQRHGLTPMAGFLAGKARILPEDLLEFAQLYHPAHHVAIEQDLLDRAVCVEILYQGAPSPTATRLHLHLSAAEEGEEAPFLVAGELLRFAKEFLQEPDQVTYSLDPAGEVFEWLPLLVSPCGLSNGRVPAPDHFAGILRFQGRGEESRLIAALNLLHARGIPALLPAELDGLLPEKRVDAVAFPGSICGGGGGGANIAPRLVVINGRIILGPNGESSAAPPREGSLFLAPPHDT